MEAIYFNKENTYGKGHPVSTDYFIKPDMVICENGIGRPRRELLSYVGYQDKGSEEKVSLGNEHISLLPVLLGAGVGLETRNPEWPPCSSPESNEIGCITYYTFI